MQHLKAPITRSRRKRLFRIVLIALASPVVLFLLLALLIYLPPVQRFAVQQVTAFLAETTGMQVSVGTVRLAFPLDLALGGVTGRDAQGDTLASLRALRLDVRLLPLLRGCAEIDGFSLYDARLNTKELIPNTYVRGYIGRLTAESHGVEWGKGRLRLDRAVLAHSDLWIALSDTAAPDTTKSAPWRIRVDRVAVKNTRLALSMPGDSMRIGARLGQAQLYDGSFDTGKPHYALRRLVMRGSALTYATRPAWQAAGKGNEAFRRATQLLSEGFRPVSAGLDAHCLVLNDLSLRIDTLTYDAAGTLRAGLGDLSFVERSGLHLRSLRGNIYMDTTRLRLPALALRTPTSRVDVAAEIALNALTEGKGGSITLDVDAALSPQDVRTLSRGYVEEELLAALPAKPLVAKARVGGNIDHLRAERFELSLPGALRLTGEGEAQRITTPQRSVQASVHLDAPDARFVKGFLPRETAAAFDIPRGLRADARLALRDQRVKASMKVGARGGQLAADATVALRAERYDVQAVAQAFPLDAFLPSKGLGAFSGSVKASGTGFDPTALGAHLQANAQVSRFAVSGNDLGGIVASATVAKNQALCTFTANNALIEGEGRLEATLGRNDFSAQLKAQFDGIHLYRVIKMRDTLSLGSDVDLAVQATRDLRNLSLTGGVRHIRFLTPRKSIMAKDLLFAAHLTPDTTTLTASAGDLDLAAGAQGTPDGLGGKFARLSRLVQLQVDTRSIDQNALAAALPALNVTVDAGRENPLSRILQHFGIDYRTAALRLSTSARDGVAGSLRVSQLSRGNLLLDTIDARLFQDSAGVKLHADVCNTAKQNPNHFSASLQAYLLATGLGARLTFDDETGRRGIDLGTEALLEDGGLRLSLYPEHPVIAYRNFTVNRANYVHLSREGMVRADVDLLADDGTGLRIKGEPKDSANDLTVSISRLNLGELSRVMPYLPRLEGLLTGDVHLQAARENLSTAALFRAEGLKYEGAALGNVGVEAIYLPQAEGEHYASAYVNSEGREVMECEGTYHAQGDGHFEGTARLHEFPLQLLNAFLAGTDIALQGAAGGELAVSGTPAAPQINGTLQCDTARVRSDVYGFDLGLDNRPLEIKDNQLRFDDFRLTSRQSQEPLRINGAIDMRDFSRIGMDMTMRAQNFELISAERNRLSVVYGRVFANYLGTLRGTLDNLSVRGKLEVLDRTDMTYILKDSPLTVESRLNDLVRFTSFDDTTQVAEAAVATPSGLDVTLGISVSDAARFHCSLSEDGSNYVDIEGGGNLTLRLTQQGEMRLTGRFTANSGEMKYSLPVIPLKTFTLAPGSYVDFTGEPMNPTLAIAATERVKATVTENDQPRAVAFNVGVAITKPLEDMGLEFTIDAPEDLTVQNQLRAMTREQRGKAAVALLATGMYVTDEMLAEGGSGLKASNALNAFLQNEIQNIAGSALRTIDLSVGMESGTSSEGTSTTDYSFRFAKRFWGNRVSVIVGGRVSTGQDADNSAASIIDNIAVEYRLDRTASRYVRMFYDRSTRDPLEGELTKTGAGLVLRKKSDRLGELFIFRRKKNTSAAPSQSAAKQTPAQ